MLRNTRFEEYFIVWVWPEAKPETVICGQIVGLGGDLENTTRGAGSETGKGRKPVSGV